MEKPTISKLLEHYKDREPTEFQQWDCFIGKPNEFDGLVSADEDGDSIWGPSTTWELMHGSNVRVFVKPGTTKVEVCRVLDKIGRYIEQKSRFEKRREQPEDPEKDRWQELEYLASELVPGRTIYDVLQFLKNVLACFPPVDPREDFEGYAVRHAASALEETLTRVAAYLATIKVEVVHRAVCEVLGEWPGGQYPENNTK